MTGCKPYFDLLVKDDFQRFFHEAGALSPSSPKTLSERVRARRPAHCYIQKGFPLIIYFQRYPNILVTER